MTRVVRRLGFGEARMHVMQSLLHGSTQGAVCVRAVGEIDPRRFAEALAGIRARHAMLGLTVQEIDGEFFFAESTADTRIDWLPTRSAPDDGLAVLQQQNAIPLDAARETWRVVVVPYAASEPTHDVLVVMHHAIMDAGGTDTLLNELFAALAGEALPTHATPVGPDAESACLVSVDWSQFQDVQKTLAGRVHDTRPQRHRGAAALQDRRTVTRAFRLSSTATALLLAECERTGVTVNSHVSAALLRAVRAQSPERDEFALHTAVSLRRLCPASEATPFGCYLAVVPTFHRVADAGIEIAPLAKEHQSALQSAFVRYAKPPRDYDAQALRGGAERLRSGDTFVNDIGFTYAESSLRTQYGALRLTQLHVVAGRAAGNAAAVLHGLKFGDEIFFTLSHVDPLQSEDWADGVLRHLVHALNATQE